MKQIIYPILFFLTFCSSQDPRDKKYPIQDDLFKKREALFQLETKKLKEISGIEASNLHSGLFWGHNDSGDDARIYLFDITGKILSSYLLKNKTHRDWEDITAYEESNVSYLIIADIGDNKAKREYLTLYRIREPQDLAESSYTIPEEEIESMQITYSEGPRDAETLFYDHLSENLILITKREENVLVYSFPFERDAQREITSLGTLPLQNIVAGDANSFGEILIKNYDNIFYWGASGQSMTERILNLPEVRIPYQPEPQGEAICWDETRSFYVISEAEESVPQIFYHYGRLR